MWRSWALAAAVLAASATALPDGLLDVTAAPYSVDPTGQADATAALQRAITDAHAQRAAVFFPAGRYLVSDTLQVELPNGDGMIMDTASVPARFIPNVLMGSTAALPRRPVLVLQANASGYDAAAAAPKAVVNVFQPEADINMNQVFRGIDIEVLEGNPMAVGVQFTGAQGSALQDVTITFAGASGFAGVAGGLGAGAGMGNVAVFGGDYGVYYNYIMQSPYITGLTLAGQRVSPVYFLTSGILSSTLTITAANISHAAAATGPAIDASGSAWAPLALVDSVLTTADASGNLTAVLSGSSVLVKNVYVSAGYGVLLAATNGRPAISLDVASAALVHEAVRGNTSDLSTDPANPFTADVAYVNGARQVGVQSDNVTAVAGVPAGAAAAFRAVHVWDEATYASFEDGATVDAKAQCGAAGDGTTDDLAALQRCVDEHTKVFLPRGDYRLSNTLQLRAGTQLVGLGMGLSRVMAMTTGFAGPTVTAPGQQAPPLIRTDNATANTVAFLGVYSFWHVNVATLHWQARGGMYRSCYDTRESECMLLGDYGHATPPVPCPPSIIFKGAKTLITGSGRFFSLHNDEDFLFTDLLTYSHIYMKGAADVAVYGLNTEHGQGQGDVVVENSTRVTFYSMKWEGSNCRLWVRDSTDVVITGTGGSSDPYPDASWYPAGFAPYVPTLIRVERSTFSIYNLINPPRGNSKTVQPAPITTIPLTASFLHGLPGIHLADADYTALNATYWTPWPGYAVNPFTYHIFVETDGPAGRPQTLVAPYDFPVVVKRTV